MPMQAPAQNPMVALSALTNAMRNPEAFIRQKFPDIPAGMSDPTSILNYLQQTRGIPNERINQLLSIYGGGIP